MTVGFESGHWSFEFDLFLGFTDYGLEIETPRAPHADLVDVCNVNAGGTLVHPIFSRCSRFLHCPNTSEPREREEIGNPRPLVLVYADRVWFLERWNAPVLAATS